MMAGVAENGTEAVGEQWESGLQRRDAGLLDLITWAKQQRLSTGTQQTGHKIRVLCYNVCTQFPLMHNCLEVTTATSAALSMPRLALVPTSAHAGDRVLVSGSGFSPNELVTLALNGEALATTALRTSGQGRFTATFTAPDGLLTGANRVSAVGATSRRVALATVRGRRSTQTYYLAGGVESSTEHAALDLLNPSTQRTHVGYTLYSVTGATTRGTLTVGAHAVRVVPVSSLTHLRGSVGLALRTDRPIAAQVTLTRQGRDGDTILATPGTARLWYLVAGETARTFHESLALLNPDRTRSVQVRLRLLPSGRGRSRTVTVRVRPHTHLVQDITPLLPGQSLSIIAEASGPVVVERRLTFSRDALGHDYGLTTRLGTTAPAPVWLLAQGTPLPHGETYLTLLKPTTRTAHVTVRFYGSSGRLVGSRTIRLNGPGRAQTALPSAGPTRGAAGVVTSDQPLVVERTEYSGSPNGLRTAGSAVFGRNGVAPRWSFPGGDTRRGQREVLLLDNPLAAPVRVVATLYGSDGRMLRQHVTLPPNVPSTLDVGRSFPGRRGCTVCA
jgi:hypothetical protein